MTGPRLRRTIQPGEARARRRNQRGQDGFTLVEMLVAMAAGLVVMMGMFSLLDVSTRISARTVDRVDSSQRGRTAMEELEQELHSSCVWAQVLPIQAGSTSTSVSFVSGFGGSAVLTPNLHVVSLTNGNLVDSVYPAIGGTAPNWTFSSTASTNKVLASNVSQATVSGVQQPVFQYYAYSGTEISSTPLNTPLSASDAANAVEVAINFAVGPTDGSTEADRTVNLSDQVVLRLTPPTGTNSNPPCQ